MHDPYYKSSAVSETSPGACAAASCIFSLQIYGCPCDALRRGMLLVQALTTWEAACALEAAQLPFFLRPFHTLPEEYCSSALES